MRVNNVHILFNSQANSAHDCIGDTKRAVALEDSPEREAFYNFVMAMAKEQSVSSSGAEEVIGAKVQDNIQDTSTPRGTTDNSSSHIASDTHQNRDNNDVSSSGPASASERQSLHGRNSHL